MADRRVALAGVTIILAQISINLGAATAKGLFPRVGPEGVAALRSTIAALLLLAVVRPWRVAIPARQRGLLILYGLSLGGMNLLIYAAFARIPIGIAIAVEICGPLSIVLLTSRSLRDLLWFGLAAGSLILLAPGRAGAGALDPVGVAYALAAAACWAFYILVGKRVSTVRGPVAVAIGMSVACLVTVPAGLVTAGAALFDPAVIAVALLVALLSSALPYLLEMSAMARVSSRLFGVIISCAPAIGALAGFAILGERLLPLQWCGIVGMIAASAGCSLTSRPRPLPETEAYSSV